MKRNLLLILAATMCFSVTSSQIPQVTTQGFLSNSTLTMKDFTNLDISKEFLSIFKPYKSYIKNYTVPLSEIRNMLEHYNLNDMVIAKVLKTIKCMQNLSVEHNNILTIIDYSMPSNTKRLWVFNLRDNKLLFNTYVSHGIMSGTLLTEYFSNKFNSKSSSIGLYKTKQTYYGRDGLSLRLDGLDYGFNHNASNRYIVMHGSWYVEEDFIKKYGRAGRSWGCPALPLNFTSKIINTIKDGAIFVVYYPDNEWFLKSKYLNCNRTSPIIYNKDKINSDSKLFSEDRADVVFADHNKNKEYNPIIAISATDYMQIFNTKAPLNRMLRRQVNGNEFIALSSQEFLQIKNNYALYDKINFIMPVLKNVRGYYRTLMQPINLGKIKTIKSDTMNVDVQPATSYTVYFYDKANTMHLYSTDKFIRWLGL